MNVLGLDDGVSLLTVLAAGAAFKLASSYWLYKRSTRCRENVATVTEMYIYPVKSCRGIKIQRAFCDKTGISVGGVIDRTNGQFVNMRQEPRLALISPSLTGDTLTLTAPSMEPLAIPVAINEDEQKHVVCRIWGHNIPAYDCGDKAAAWLCKFLSTEGFRLVHAAPELDKREMWNLNPNFTNKFFNKSVEGDQIAFADFSAYTVLSQGSMDDFYSKYGNGDITVANFRPNILVEGCKEFDEDNWHRVRIGKCLFRQLKPCHRCTLTTINPDSGTRRNDEEPLKTLRKYRLHPEYGNSPVFAVQFAIDELGDIQVGDSVYAERFS